MIESYAIKDFLNQINGRVVKLEMKKSNTECKSLEKSRFVTENAFF